MTKVIPFNYFGGKFQHIDFITKRLPMTKSYVEVFGGSAVILINRKPSPIETYNDINSTVVNFFECLRKYPDKLLEQIYLTPYAREEFWNCYKTINEGTDIEKARKFFVVVNQSFNGSYARLTGWKFSQENEINKWLNKIPNLKLIIERFRRTQISNYDFKNIFEKFNNSETLFYCDPPYIKSLRNSGKEYDYEMTDENHIDLLDLCNKARCKIAISGYDGKIYNKYLKDWYKSVSTEKKNGFRQSSKQEILWTNYDPDQVNNLNLF